MSGMVKMVLRRVAKVAVGAFVVLIVASEILNEGCQTGAPEDVMSVAPCSRTISVIRDFLPDSTEDHIAAELRENTRNRADLAQTCSDILTSLCEQFDPPSCSGPLREPGPDPGPGALGALRPSTEGRTAHEDHHDHRAGGSHRPRGLR